VLALGHRIHLERLPYQAWQRRYGKSVALCAPGLFVSKLLRAAASAHATVVQINARRARLSQTCHCGAVRKKRLSQRHHRCSCGVSAQRDLCSAFLACYVDPDNSQLNAGQAALAWPSREPVLQAAFQRASENQRPSGRKSLPASFGVPRASQSRSASSAQGNQAEAKSRDAVARRRARARKRRR
jgi:putative transposase